MKIKLSTILRLMLHRLKCNTIIFVLFLMNLSFIRHNRIITCTSHTACHTTIRYSHHYIIILNVIKSSKVVQNNIVCVFHNNNDNNTDNRAIHDNTKRFRQSTLLYFPIRLFPLDSSDQSQQIIIIIIVLTSTIHSQENPRDSQKYLICGLVI